jgi:heme/copper-type cytochrome/quinol oxidase subunit 3
MHACIDKKIQKCHHHLHDHRLCYPRMPLAAAIVLPTSTITFAVSHKSQTLNGCTFLYYHTSLMGRIYPTSSIGCHHPPATHRHHHSSPLALLSFYLSVGTHENTSTMMNHLCQTLIIDNSEAPRKLQKQPTIVVGVA